MVVPRKSAVTVRNDKGDITVSDMATPVTVNSASGDVDVRDTNGDVTIDMQQGDAKISDTKGDIKISGKGDSVDVRRATGNFTINGEFYGPIRADKVAKGVRFVSQRTDLTLTSAHRPHGSQLRQFGNCRCAGKHDSAHA